MKISFHLIFNLLLLLVGSGLRQRRRWSYVKWWEDNAEFPPFQFVIILTVVPSLQVDNSLWMSFCFALDAMQYCPPPSASDASEPFGSVSSMALEWSKHQTTICWTTGGGLCARVVWDMDVGGVAVYLQFTISIIIIFLHVPLHYLGDGTAGERKKPWWICEGEQRKMNNKYSFILLIRKLDYGDDNAEWREWVEAERAATKRKTLPTITFIEEISTTEGED